MSEEDWTKSDDRAPRQFGEEIIESGSPFTGETLDAIRDLVQESAPEQAVEAEGHEEAPSALNFAQVSGAMGAERRAAETHGVPHADQSGSESEMSDKGTRRRLIIAEKAPGRIVRKLMTTPRGLALVVLALVTVWRPLFIPVLAALVTFSLLLLGALIGQDRMGRIMLYMLKRYVWADPARGTALSRVLPRKWHPFLYKSFTEEDAWEGPVDPRFEARLARLRG
ncbi:hypothetical protein [Shimia sp.]|uniref:hypothetical protein n=1 Tax=Shimia sp. TaxID=1954381 RepID=UPI00329810F1